MQHRDIKIVKNDIVYTGFNKIRKYLFEFEAFDGGASLMMEKEVLERKSAAGALLYDPRLDLVVMVEQFRPGSFAGGGGAFPLEIPIGLIDAESGTPEDTARKEALEEAHCVIGKMVEIGHFFPEISFGSRKIHLFCGKTDAAGIKPHGGLRDESEDIKISAIPVGEIRRKMEDGAIASSHTLIALQWFFLNLEKIRADFA